MPNYTDGNYSAAYLVEKQIGYPLNVPNNGGTREYRLTYVQNANTYTDAAIGDTDANAPSSYLVEQGPVTRLGGGVVQFTRVFSEVPTTWAEVGETSYTYPGIAGTFGAFDPYGARKPITLFQLATTTHSYSQGVSPPARDNTFVSTLAGEPVDFISSYFGYVTTPATEPTTYTISSDVRLWRGNIWEKVTTTVPKPV